MANFLPSLGRQIFLSKNNNSDHKKQKHKTTGSFPSTQFTRNKVLDFLWLTGNFSIDLCKLKITIKLLRFPVNYLEILVRALGGLESCFDRAETR